MKNKLSRFHFLPVFVVLSQFASAIAVAGEQPATPEIWFEFEQSYIATSENTGTVTLSVRRYTDDLSPIQLNYFTADGTATAGQDYVGSSGVLSFAAGETTQQISIPILEDGSSERSEEFTVTLTDPLNRLALGAQKVATVRILDDDGPVKADRSFVPASGVDGLLAVQPDGRIFARISN